jgi:hypothetical protein
VDKVDDVESPTMLSNRRVNASRAVSRLKVFLIVCKKDDASVAHKEWNEFYHSMIAAGGYYDAAYAL